MNAPDFADMLTRSLAKTYNLLASMNNSPVKMIPDFAKVAPEEVRAMYMIDYAPRRRFSFFDIEPRFDSTGFMKYQQRLNNETFFLLVSKVQELNKAIVLDKSLEKGFCIGHSYLGGQTECTDE